MSIFHGSLKHYVIGFVLSAILTLTSYYFVVAHIDSGHVKFGDEFLIALVLSFAVLQFVIQSYFFLHLGIGKSSRWNLFFYASTLSIILVVILGSLWIMYHLNYNMKPQQMQEYILYKEGYAR